MANPAALRRQVLPPGMEPRYLSREEAAAYVGVSADTFDDEVRAGLWPPARRRGAKGTRLTWDRRMLDAYADQAGGFLQVPEQAALHPLPFKAAAAQPAEENAQSFHQPPKLSAEAAALQGIQNAAPRHRAKHRQSSPA